MTSIVAPGLTVCIPAFNRPRETAELLDSVAAQDRPSLEVLLCEDASPRRAEIRRAVEAFRPRFGGRLRYEENEATLGYDGNLRRLVEHARGDCCLFMGNDDLLAPGALDVLDDALRRHPETGVVLRAYDFFKDRPDNIVQRFRYFDGERVFPPGPGAVVTFYRRSVTISGMVVRRVDALRHASGAFDGTLLYQLHLVARILLERPGLYLPQPLALYRVGGVPDFGHSAAERGRHVPEAQTPDSSVHFVWGLLEIARRVEADCGVPVFKAIRRDVGNYAYPLLRVQAGRPTGVFARYAARLAGLGLWRYPLFHAYVGALLLAGPDRLDRLIVALKERLGSTPRIGRVYAGNPVDGTAPKKAWE